jgi:Chaperone of endosialidase
MSPHSEDQPVGFTRVSGRVITAGIMRDSVAFASTASSDFCETNRMRTIIRSLVTAVVLLCCGHLPQAKAVVPPPDGGYPNFTTAEGQNALFSLTTGAANTAVGWFSLKSVTTGSFNTGVGAATLVLNSGNENTAVGTAALLLNTASGNTAVGSRALLNNTTGGILGNIQGVDIGPNVAVGQQALESNTVASANTGVGYQALQSFTSGPTGLEQIGLCTAVGFRALANANVNGIANSSFGYNALMNNTDGVGNTGIGLQALLDNTIGSGNVAIGNNALSHSTGNNNIALGFNAGSSVTTANNLICIGSLGANVDNSCFIGNIYSNVQPIVGTDPDSVTINSSGRLGRGNVSSRRYKHDIKSMDRASEALYALKPVSFRYNKEYDATQTLAFGLIAEEVAQVYPDLVGRNPKGEPESVRYDQVNAMLLNEFLKEHATVQELKKEIAALKAGLQQVNDELKKSTPVQLAENSQ